MTMNVHEGMSSDVKWISIFGIGLIVSLCAVVAAALVGPGGPRSCSDACWPMVMESFTPAVQNTGVGCVGQPAVCKCSPTVRR